MKEVKKTGSIGSFFKIVIANLIVLVFFAVCVYKGIETFNNLSSITKTYTRFAVNSGWIDIVLFFSLAILLVVLLIYIDKTKFQKRRRDKKIIRLEETIEELKYKNENSQKAIETQSSEETSDAEKQIT